MKFRSLLNASIAVAALAAFAPANATTTFFNDWESTNFGPNAGYIILPSYEGWTATSGPGIEVQYNNIAGQALSPNNLVELDSSGNSEMSRGIDGGRYQLTFHYSPRPGVQAASNGIDVLLNGVSIFNVSGNGGNATNWSLQTVDFFLAAPGTLSFAALGTSDSLGGYIDDVRLSGAVPEPATWAMMIGGFGMMGFAARRRRASKVVFA